MSRPSTSKTPIYIPLPVSVLQQLTDQPTALLVYVVGLNLITKEIISEIHGVRFGMVLDGEPITYDDLSNRTKIPANKLRWGLGILCSLKLAATRRGSYGLQIFLVNTRKWISETSPRLRKMSPKYAWADAVMSARGTTQIATESRSEIETRSQSSATQSQSCVTGSQSSATQSQSQGVPDLCNQENTFPSYRGEQTARTERVNSRETDAPSRAHSCTENGQGKILLAEKICGRLALNHNITVNNSLRDEIAAQLRAGHSEKEIERVISGLQIEDGDRMPWKTIKDHLKYGLAAHQEAKRHAAQMEETKSIAIAQSRAQAEAENAEIQRRRQEEENFFDPLFDGPEQLRKRKEVSGGLAGKRTEETGNDQRDGRRRIESLSGA